MCTYACIFIYIYIHAYLWFVSGFQYLQPNQHDAAPSAMRPVISGRRFLRTCQIDGRIAITFSPSKNSECTLRVLFLPWLHAREKPLDTAISNTRSVHHLIFPPFLSVRDAAE